MENSNPPRTIGDKLDSFLMFCAVVIVIAIGWGIVTSYSYVAFGDWLRLSLIAVLASSGLGIGGYILFRKETEAVYTPPTIIVIDDSKSTEREARARGLADWKPRTSIDMPADLLGSPAPKEPKTVPPPQPPHARHHRRPA